MDSHYSQHTAASPSQIKRPRSESISQSTNTPPISTHDPNPNQNPEHTAHLWLFRSLIHHLSSTRGGCDTAHAQAIHLLSRLLALYLTDLAYLAASVAQASGRSHVQFSDLIPVLDRVGISLGDLHATLLDGLPAARASHAAYRTSLPGQAHLIAPPFNPLFPPAAPVSSSSSTSANKKKHQNATTLLPILAPTYGHDTKLVPVSVLEPVTTTQSIHPAYPIVVDAEKHPLVVKKLQSLPMRPPALASAPAAGEQPPLATVIVPRTHFPPHVSAACPKFPPPHTYKRTPVMPLHATHTSRAPLLADQRKLMEANLRRLMTKHPQLFSSDRISTDSEVAPAVADGPSTARQNTSSESDLQPTESSSAHSPHHKHARRLVAIKALTLSQPAMWWKHAPAKLPKHVLDTLTLPPPKEDSKGEQPMDVDATAAAACPAAAAPASLPRLPARTSSPPAPPHGSPPRPALVPTMAATRRTSPRRSPLLPMPATLDPAAAAAATAAWSDHVVVTPAAPVAPERHRGASPPPPPPVASAQSPPVSSPAGPAAAPLKLRVRAPTPTRAPTPPAPAPPAPTRAPEALPSAGPGPGPVRMQSPRPDPAAAAAAATGGAGAHSDAVAVDRNGHVVPEAVPLAAVPASLSAPAAATVATTPGDVASALDTNSTLTSASSNSTASSSARSRVSSGGVLRFKIKPLGVAGSAPPAPPQGQ